MIEGTGPAAEEPPEGGSTVGQAERRRRVLVAAAELAADGGYDAVQMRDVAARAGVALGTVYRYFSSKDVLLAEVLVEWSLELEGRVESAGPPGDTAADRMVSVVRAGFDLVAGSPRLAAAVLRALVAGGREVARSQGQVGQVLERVALGAFPPGFDERTARTAARVLGHQWFAVLVAWASGWVDAAEAMARMEEAVHLLLDQYG